MSTSTPAPISASRSSRCRDRFLDGAGRHVVCSAHGARFRAEDGFCVSGPCAGDSLEAVPVRMEDGVVLVPADAGL